MKINSESNRINGCRLYSPDSEVPTQDCVNLLTDSRFLPNAGKYFSGTGYICPCTRHEDYKGSICIAPLILILGIKRS